MKQDHSLARDAVVRADARVMEGCQAGGKAPWSLVPMSYGYDLVYSADGACIQLDGGDLDGEEQAAFDDACALISAAPDLLAVAQTAPNTSRYHGVNGFEVERFLTAYEAWAATKRAATSKATGADQ